MLFLLGFHQYIDEAMPPESPYLYGLHPNAEIGFLTTTSDNLFRTVFEMQPRDAGASGGSSVTREDKVSTRITFSKAHCRILDDYIGEANFGRNLGKVARGIQLDRDHGKGGGAHTLCDSGVPRVRADELSDQ